MVNQVELVNMARKMLNIVHMLLGISEARRVGSESTDKNRTWDGA
uniref:Transposase n=1 Tax=Steinernema glaseri TaxID=37863 RepID=A0A1I7Z040_9BILA